MDVGLYGRLQSVVSLRHGSGLDVHDHQPGPGVARDLWFRNRSDYSYEKLGFARLFCNMEGREPQGLIPREQYAAFQDEMKAKFEALADGQVQPMNSLVFEPKEIYKNVRNVAPDLIVHFGGPVLAFDRQRGASRRLHAGKRHRRRLQPGPVRNVSAGGARTVRWPTSTQSRAG